MLCVLRTDGQATARDDANTAPVLVGRREDIGDDGLCGGVAGGLHGAGVLDLDFGAAIL